MKFAKVLEQTLIEEDIPQEWVEAAIQYKSLKKCITKVVNELRFLGLEQKDLKLLLNDPTNKKIIEVDEQETSPTNPIIAEYSLTKPVDENADPNNINPTLRITLDYSNQDYSDDHIYQLGLQLKHRIESLLDEDSDETHDDPQDENLRKVFQQIKGKNKVQKEKDIEDLEKLNLNVETPHPVRARSSSPHERVIKLREQNNELQITSPPSSRQNSREGSPPPEKVPAAPLDQVLETPADMTRKNEIYISLNSDIKFFKMLNDELKNLDNLKMSEEAKLTEEVERIAQVITTLVDPKRKLKNSDLYKWRELFKIYLDSEVYFKYNETKNSTSERNSQQIKSNLDAFNKNVEKSGILTQFKNKKSLATFNQFVNMNNHLLKILQFQSINTEAFRKILKKFDKRTALGISSRFPELISRDHIFIEGGSLAQSICYIIQTSILRLLPQLDDYTCPICMSIAFKPIKLWCGHMFCVRCLVKLKQQGKTNCPICRNEGAIVKADGRNLDVEVLEMMKKYFPVEVKEKLKERDQEKYSEIKRKDANPEKCNMV